MVRGREWALEEASKCLYCGFCEAVCPTLPHGPHRGYGPRGRVTIVYRLLSGKPVTEETVASLFSCLGCRACTLRCPVSIDVAELVRVARSLYLQGVFGKRVRSYVRVRGEVGYG